MFASASAHIFAQAATIFDEKISSYESHRLLFVKAVGSPPPVSSHPASRSALAPLFQQAASCLRASHRKRLCAEIPPRWSQNSEVSDQKSQRRRAEVIVKRQKSAVRSQSPHFLRRNKKRFRLFDHAAKHSANLCTFLSQGMMLFDRDVSVLPGEVQR